MVSSNPLKIYTSTSFVGDLSYQAPVEQVAGMAHTFVTGRKTWKTLKHKKEAVWPAYIEAALFHALELYRPSSSADPRSLRRFPKRNRFISDHIYKVTGKVRTPKQVGSRLQQLRDTCQEDKVLKLLSRRDFPSARLNLSRTRSRSPSASLSPASSMVSSLPSSASNSPASSPTVAEFPEFFTRALNLRIPVNGQLLRPVLNTTPPVVYLNVATTVPPSRGTQNVPSVETQPLVTFNLYGGGSPSPAGTSSVHHVTLYPLDDVPTIKFFSDMDISSTHQSMFYVFYDDRLLYSEAVPIHASLSNGMLKFGTQMIPKSWSSFCRLVDLHRYTIAQDVMNTSTIGENETIQDLILFSVTYKFQSSYNASPLAQSSPTIDFPVGNATQASSALPIQTPRPLLLDTANTLLSAPPLQPERVWFDNCGDAINPPYVESAFDFVSVSCVDPSDYCRVEQPSEDGYLDFPYWTETSL